MIGGPTRSRATRNAVAPDDVQATMTLISSVSPMSRAAIAMASAEVGSGSGRCAVMIERYSASVSTSIAMRSIIDTASIGYLPTALSAESMTASAPSKMACATSDTSARVGTGEVIIDSSICVATTTGLPWRRARRTMRFWMPGTCSSGISTPRSPRATIRPSDSAMISSSLVSACGFSIFDMTRARPSTICLISLTSSGR